MGYMKRKYASYEPGPSMLLIAFNGQHVVDLFKMPQHTLDLNSDIPTCHKSTAYDAGLAADTPFDEYFPEAPMTRSKETEVLPWFRSGLSQAKRWLRDCSTHSKCNEVSPHSQFFPKRLVYIDNASPPGLRLVLGSTINASEKYMTLSHCWGQLQPYKLLKENCEDLKINVDYQKLPTTFQHAMLVTQALNIHYLWIDSLCIIQDCSVDWRQESSTMGEVYAHGHCNICASSATDSSQGLFYNRNPLRPPEVRVLIRRDGGMVSGTWGGTMPDAWEKNVGDGPLLSRAWVVQERLLSRCNLHFTSSQVFWECCEGTSCETIAGAFFPKDYMMYWGGQEKKDLTLTLPKNLEGPLSVSDSGIQQLWNNIVNTYTKGNLTKETDRLVAFSGIASRFSEILKSQLAKRGIDDCPRYLAGLWNVDIIPQLLWKAGDESEGRGKPTQYIAPSWSWASINGPVSFSAAAGDIAMVRSLEVTLLDDSQPFGGVSAGSITLVCKMAIMEFPEPKERKHSSDLSFRTRSGLREAHEFSTVLRLDYESDRTSGGVFYFVPLQENLFERLVDGLLLKSTGEPNENGVPSLPSRYRRVGVLGILESQYKEVLIPAIRFCENEHSHMLTETCEEVEEFGIGNKAFAITII